MWYTRGVSETQEKPLPEGDRLLDFQGSLDARERAILCARLFDERRLRDILIFDVGDVLQIAEFFVIGTGTSQVQLKKTADYVVEKFREVGVRPLGTEGYDQARWVLYDFDEVVIHLMEEDTRQYYNLELLWGDCPQVPWKDES